MKLFGCLLFEKYAKMSYTRSRSRPRILRSLIRLPLSEIRIGDEKKCVKVGTVFPFRSFSIGHKPKTAHLKTDLRFRK